MAAHSTFCTLIGFTQLLVAEDIIFSEAFIDPNNKSCAAEPRFREVPGPPPQMFMATFQNHSPDTINLYFDDGVLGVYQGKMGPNETLDVGTYVGHQFHFRRPREKIPILCAPRTPCYVTMETNKTTYTYMNQEQREQEAAALEAEKAIFVEQYLNETGRPWLHTYPRYGFCPS